ncbi:hypothetical protein AAFN85_18975 [Mucilaginibacter sp. CAU 1740]|uniref:hypothetical protein n=1 Tax=Mucilaginibacter sp. CAU 1740 TaxID=3140365 RepID=UPI00325B463A
MEARTSLPSIHESDNDMLIISVGRDRGTFSHRHIETDDDTHHFVFVKNDELGWRCIDLTLQRWLDQHHAAASRMLQEW